jgi:Zn-dependent protease with chaperone function
VRVVTPHPQPFSREKEYSADAVSAQPLDRMAETLFDDAAAQTHFPVVEDGGLARGHRSLLLVEDDPDGLIVDGLIRQGISSCR